MPTFDMQGEKRETSFAVDYITLNDVLSTSFLYTPREPAQRAPY